MNLLRASQGRNLETNHDQITQGDQTNVETLENSQNRGGFYGSHHDRFGVPLCFEIYNCSCFPPWSKHGTTCQGFLSCHTRTSKQGTADGGPATEGLKFLLEDLV